MLPYLQVQLSIYDLSKYETIVLGCTHFSYYKDILSLKGNGNISFYCSGVKVEDKAKLKVFNKLFKRLDAINEM